MSAKCPRCGEEMTGGICDNCGFPITKMRKKINNGEVTLCRKLAIKSNLEIDSLRSLRND